MLPYSTEDAGLRLTVRLTPRGGRDALEGVSILADGQAVLHVRVRAVPEDGRANDALCTLLAKEFAVPKSSVALISGATGRRKVVSIKGDVDRLAGIIRAHLNRASR